MNSEEEGTNTTNTNTNDNNNTSTNSTTDLHEIEPVYLYQWVDCCDEYNKWYEAQITAISPSSNRHIKVHYKGWKSKFDTWINLNNVSDFNRVCELHKHTIRPSKIYELDSYSIGTSCDCLDSTDKWYSASIIEISLNNKLLKIHFNNWDSKYDEWINKNSYRIAPLHTHTTGPPTAVEIKEDTNDSNNRDSDISESQREINRVIQEKYLSNFKPSLLDEEEFELKLSSIGLSICSMGEDGNCLFRSISHQVYGKQDFHMIIRKKCCEYLRSEYSYFGSYIPGGHDKEIFLAYCLRMECSGIWGDNLEIQAFSEIYGRSIEIYAYDNKPMKIIKNETNNNKKNTTPIRLSYHCNSHYNSIINEEIFEENIISSDKIGEIEDEKIRLSSLRSIHASEKTLNISDIEATELELFNKILQLSRTNDGGNNCNMGNKQLDIAIKKSLKSLKEYENKSVQNAVKESLYQQEQHEIQMALKKSQYDFHYQQQQLDNNNQNENENNNSNNNFNYNNNNNNNSNNNFNFNNNNIIQFQQQQQSIDDSIKILVDKGYSLEQATLAYSVFESQKNQIPKEVFIQRMEDYIENTKKASMFGYQNFYNLE